MSEERMMWPTLDSHTGDPPKLGAPVRLDHWLITGSDQSEPGRGVDVNYRDCGEEIRQFLPNRVIGRKYQTHESNGDFVIDTEKVREELMVPQRVTPDQLVAV